jgi:predicted GNAT family acetyltransferase
LSPERGDTMEYEIKQKPDMFFIRLNPGKYAYLKYTITDNKMNVNSTFTPIEWRRKGLAAMLMKNAIDYAKKKQLQLIPACSYARYYLKKNKL